MRGPVVAEQSDNDTDDYHAHTHHHGSNEEERLSADLVNDQHGGDCADKENNTGNTSCKQGDGATCETKADKDVGGVVDD